ncbi:hypothetical protein SAMN05519103_04554 [Rhizobiales bacterium GAS113]|nr:hypothetical protein SAMN05519103_04554 [Rhizobiales bacterium GAS113]
MTETLNHAQVDLADLHGKHASLMQRHHDLNEARYALKRRPFQDHGTRQQFCELNEKIAQLDEDLDISSFSIKKAAKLAEAAARAAAYVEPIVKIARLKFTDPEHGGIFTCKMPPDARIVKVDLFDGLGVMWYEFKDGGSMREREFRLIAERRDETFCQLPVSCRHVGTWINGPEVWHVVERAV